MELISLQALQRVKPVPPLPYRVRVCVLLSVALAVAQGKTVLACRLNITNATTLVPYLRGPLLAVPQNFFEKRVAEYQKVAYLSNTASQPCL